MGKRITKEHWYTFFQRHWLAIILFIAACTVAIVTARGTPQPETPPVAEKQTNQQPSSTSSTAINLPGQVSSRANLSAPTLTQTGTSVLAQITSSAVSPISISSATSRSVPVTLAVLDNSYQTTVATNTSVYTLMRQLAAETSFTFTGTDHGALGFFVESINGAKQNPRAGLYWIYSINDAKATVGISNYIIQPNDRITWTYEKAE